MGVCLLKQHDCASAVQREQCSDKDNVDIISHKMVLWHFFYRHILYIVTALVKGIDWKTVFIVYYMYLPHWILRTFLNWELASYFSLNLVWTILETENEILERFFYFVITKHNVAYASTIFTYVLNTQNLYFLSSCRMM